MYERMINEKKRGRKKSYLPVYGVLKGQLDLEGTGTLVFEMGVGECLH